MPLLHPKTKKRWLNWLLKLVIVGLVVPLIKLIAFFKVMRMRSQPLEMREEWVADYLRLEHGEDEADPDSLKSSDLKYLGRFNLDGHPTDYWQYPTSDGHGYATISITKTGEALSMTDEPPTGEQLS